MEIMPEAIATREANGMKTIFEDVWDGLLEPERIETLHDIYIASPPCQTFSAAGSGAGRRALDDVLQAIDNRAFEDVRALQALADQLDPRTALVLTPLAYVWANGPRYVVFEQVPPVLPVWQACAKILEERGYYTWTGILNAEQYGVPQTRKRAILMARLSGPVEPPTPTHSRYYPRDPQKLDEGVLPWVSMAEALNWGLDQRPSFTVTGGGTEGGGGYEPYAKEARLRMQKAQEEGRWQFAGAGATAQETSRQRPRDLDEPAHTVTGSRTATWVAAKAMGSGMVERHGDRPDRPLDTPAFTLRASAGGMEPGGFRWVLRSNYGTNGDPENRGEREETQPAPTMTSKGNRNLWVEKPTPETWQWSDRPATTVAGDPRITAREHHFPGEQGKTALRLTVEQASLLQSYPEDFVWVGTKTKQFLQIGNAVPPRLAEAILTAVIS